jgi:hypothetical protein
MKTEIVKTVIELSLAATLALFLTIAVYEAAQRWRAARKERRSARSALRKVRLAPTANPALRRAMLVKILKGEP